MNRDLDKLQHAVERDLQMLGDLPSVELSTDVLTSVHARVQTEAARWRQQSRWNAIGRATLSVAAAAALMLTFGGPLGGYDDTTILRPQMRFNEWAAAWDASGDQVTDLLDGGWVDAGLDEPDPDEELDTLFESLESSFSQFESL